MSEQNILNPTAGSLFGPDYSFTEGLPETRAIFLPRSGNAFIRQQQGLGRAYSLAWGGRSLTTKLAMQQWENQYRDDFFTLADWESGRYFTGHFDGPLSYSPGGNNRWDIKGSFVELPGLPMYAPATNWGRDSIFLEERNGRGEDLVKLTGTWTFTSSAHDHGGASYVSNVTNDAVEWLYFGYGHRIWGRKGPDAGILQYSAIRVRDAAASGGPSTFDQYSAAIVDAAMLIAASNGSTLPLDWYRVKLAVTGTKNASASDYKLYADALEVMR